MKSIKTIRASAGLTQEELARAIGVDRVTVANWESGKTEPKLSQACKIANLCGVKIENMIGGNKNEGSDD